MRFLSLCSTAQAPSLRISMFQERNPAGNLPFVELKCVLAQAQPLLPPRWQAAVQIIDPDLFISHVCAGAALLTSANVKSFVPSCLCFYLLDVAEGGRELISRLLSHFQKSPHSSGVFRLPFLTCRHAVVAVGLASHRARSNLTPSPQTHESRNRFTCSHRRCVKSG